MAGQPASVCKQRAERCEFDRACRRSKAVIEATLPGDRRAKAYGKDFHRRKPTCAVFTVLRVDQASIENMSVERELRDVQNAEEQQQGTVTWPCRHAEA